MEFFKRFGSKEKFNAEPTNEALDKKIEDQHSISIKGDVSIDDYTGALNRRAFGNSENLDPSVSFEEMELEKRVQDRFEHLMLTYNEINQKLKERNAHAEMLTTRSRNATRNARRIALEAMQKENSFEALSSAMDIAIKRADRLMTELQKTTNELVDYSQELKAVQEDIERVAGLMPRSEDEEPFNPNLN